MQGTARIGSCAAALMDRRPHDLAGGSGQRHTGLGHAPRTRGVFFCVGPGKPLKDSW